MDDPSTDFSPGMLHRYIYLGAWERFYESLMTRYVWTFKTIPGLLFFAGLTCLIAYSQSRVWVILRYFLLWRAGDDVSIKPLYRLSQGKAIIEVLPYLKARMLKLGSLLRRSLKRIPRKPNDPLIFFHRQDIPPKFGLVALLNVSIFAILGVVVPWSMSEGTFGDVIVRSRETHYCRNTSNTVPWFLPLQQFKTEAVFQLCNDGLSQGCDKQYYMRQPRITKKNLHTCMFPGDICQNSTDAFEITHLDAMTYDFGINYRSKVRMNHRLTCSPVHLDSFLVSSSGQNDRANISVWNPNIKDGEQREQKLQYYTMPLKSRSGLYHGLEEGSEERLINEPTLFDLSVLPGTPELIQPMVFPWRADEHQNNATEDLIHPALRREDGVSFLVVHRDGKSLRRVEVDDPFFAAHTKCSDSQGNGEFYCSDSEATALGCLEQFQYCLPDWQTCTPWGFHQEPADTAMRELLDDDDLLSMVDFGFLEAARYTLSVKYLLERRGHVNIVPLTKSMSFSQASQWDVNLSGYLNRMDQWTVEVETWFRQGILEQILRSQYGARYSIATPILRLVSNSSSSDEQLQVLENLLILCDRILSREEGFININFFGLWSITSFLIILCVASFRVQWIDTGTNPPLR
ncbi:hypothetical protein BJ875DRAFT_440621 [Amylocarpus encephaloides]|uniref:Uncharacterized protein n=1 Tax=Amylocarpus encephaloides TaxID=45428 RepID=A0A9P7YKF3_9HELO|nr:hypothetical protein BJ875DRAFT_440621 [Amylocarpus encephaloides]